MQINSINNFLNIPKIKSTKSCASFGCYPNLKPLPKDTVSFSGNIKQEKIDSSSKKIEHIYRPNLQTATKLREESNFAYSLLQYFLKQEFDAPVIDTNSKFYEENMLNSTTSNKNVPVIAITTRQKSANSIAEKMATLKVKNAEEAKAAMNDIIGARIIVSGNSTKEGDFVLQKIQNLIKKGKLKVIEVKKHGQEDKRLDYVSDKALKKFLKTAKNCEFKDQPRDSGYLAVHLITDNIIDGYNAEIQIMGLDVVRFKEIEDLCYKCSAGKNIPPKYKEFAEDFKVLKEDPKIAEDYLEYTKRAYAKERGKDDFPSNKNLEFLPVPDDLSIPESLDFNRIAHMKNMADGAEN